MTSSYRALSQASVRATPTASSVADLWSLDELSLPTNPARAAEADPMAVAKEQSRLIDEGYARGLADGERRGWDAAQGRLHEALAVLARATNEMRDVASMEPAILEENVAALAVIVARQIVAREVSLDREVVADLVRRALTEFPVEHNVRIRVNPIDLSLLTNTASGTAEMTPITGARDASWQADPTVERGGCVIEGRDRIVDGRVDSALERAYRRMAAVDAS